MLDPLKGISFLSHLGFLMKTLIRRHLRGPHFTSLSHKLTKPSLPLPHSLTAATLDLPHNLPRSPTPNHQPSSIHPFLFRLYSNPDANHNFILFFTQKNLTRCHIHLPRFIFFHTLTLRRHPSIFSTHPKPPFT